MLLFHCRLYDAISDQKSVVLSCLESEACDVRTLEAQMSTLQSMQNRYSKMEYDRARQVSLKNIAAHY